MDGDVSVAYLVARRLSQSSWLRSVIALLALLSAVVEAQAQQSPAKAAVTLTTWTDDNHQAWQVPQTLPKRWVVLGPHLVDMLRDLQVQHVIVGVQDDHPSVGRWQKSLTGFPVVAQASQINEEQIRRVKPDLVVYWPSGLAGNQQARLRQLGIPMLAIDPKKLEDIPTRLNWLGALAGQSARATNQANKLQRNLQETRLRYAQGPRLRGLYQVWLQPLYSLAPQHVVSQAMAVCGVDSIVPKTSVPAPILQLEFVLKARPDVILLSQDQLLPSQKFWQRFQQIPAVKKQRLVVVNDRELTRPGLSLLRELPTLCDQILPFRTLPN